MLAVQPFKAGAVSGQRVARTSRQPLQCTASAVVCPKLVQQARVMALVGKAWSRSNEGRQSQAKGLREQLSAGASWMAAIMPFASTAVNSTAHTTAEIYGALAKAIDIYLLVLTVRVILTWFRNINWFNEPFATLRQFTDPFLNVFRGILPNIGGIDLSPMLGFFILNFARNQLVYLSRTMIL